jgi:hypothetical protein
MEIIKCVATHPTPDIGNTHRHLHNLYNSRDIATVGLRATQERASAVMAQHVKDSIGKKFLSRSKGMEIIKCVATHPTPDIGKTHRHLHNSTIPEILQL